VLVGDPELVRQGVEALGVADPVVEPGGGAGGRVTQDVALERRVRARAGQDEVVVAGRRLAVLGQMRKLAREDPLGGAVEVQRRVVAGAPQP
jgi:hypothetical protein